MITAPRSHSLGALGALSLGALAGVSFGAAEPEHGPGAAAFDAGQTRVAEVYEYLQPGGGWTEVSPQRFGEIEQAFREAGDDAGLTSRLRYGSVPETVGEVRWATRILPSTFWFRTNAAQWAEYSSSGISDDPRAGVVNCWAPGGRVRHCKIVKVWRRSGAPVWTYLEASGFQWSPTLQKPQNRMALYLGLGAAAFFGWRMIGRRSA